MTIRFRRRFPPFAKTGRNLAFPMVLAGCSLLLSSPSHAVAPLVVNPIVLPDPSKNLNPSAPPYTEATSTDATYGFWFETSQPMTVNALGVYSSSGILAAIHRVGLWDFATTDLLSSATIHATNGDVCPGFQANFCWVAINPLLLKPGNYQVAATGGWATDSIALFGGVSVLRPGVTWIASSYSDVTDPIADAYPYFPFPLTPGNGDEDTVPVWGGNLSVAVAAETVPTPGPLPLAGAAAAHGWARRLRRRVTR